MDPIDEYFDRRMRNHARLREVIAHLKAHTATPIEAMACCQQALQQYLDLQKEAVEIESDLTAQCTAIIRLNQETVQINQETVQRVEQIEAQMAAFRQVEPPQSPPERHQRLRRSLYLLDLPLFAREYPLADGATWWWQVSLEAGPCDDGYHTYSARVGCRGGALPLHTEIAIESAPDGYNPITKDGDGTPLFYAPSWPVEVCFPLPPAVAQDLRQAIDNALILLGAV